MAFLDGMTLECGEGWRPIVERLATRIDERFPNDITVNQIKEKFGVLRIYYSSVGITKEDDDWIMSLIRGAEFESSTTCEVCGELGKRRGKYWIKTLCDKHGDELEARQR